MSLEDYMMPCFSKKYLGIECFGCGTQRAFVMLLRGEFSEAFHLFPAIYTLVALLLVVVLNFIDKKRNYANAMIILGIINAVIMVVSYFYRQTNACEL